MFCALPRYAARCGVDGLGARGVSRALTVETSPALGTRGVMRAVTRGLKLPLVGEAIDGVLGQDDSPR